MSEVGCREGIEVGCRREGTEVGGRMSEVGKGIGQKDLHIGKWERIADRGNEGFLFSDHF